MCENGEQGKLALLSAVGCLGNTPASLPNAHLSRGKGYVGEKRQATERRRNEVDLACHCGMARMCIFSWVKWKPQRGLR